MVLNQFYRFMYKFLKFLLILLTLSVLSGCGKGFFKRSDVKDNPVNVNDRVRKNIEEGRGIRFGRDKKGGVFDFASANELWRASVETLDFVPLVNASYSGGIIITDWFNGGSDENRDLKITIRFLSNEIRSDAIKVIVHERICNTNNNCSTNLIDSKITGEIQLAILKRAALLERKGIKKLVEERRKKDPRGGDKAIPVDQQ